ncbi:hypothetical protein C8Q78DRAFT_1037521 [Trametes maxima]|nr:hypothetical protein C8Q78DRAFT_1037521 [Trametes maxima]
MDNRTKQASLSLSFSMPPPQNKFPNPLLFLGISLLSFGAFYATLKYRATTYPASAQPRQHDNPLVPPRHRDS